MNKIIFQKTKPRFWQKRWWNKDKVRWLFAGGLVVAMVAIFSAANYDLWSNPYPLGQAEQNQSQTDTSNPAEENFTQTLPEPEINVEPALSQNEKEAIAEEQALEVAAAPQIWMPPGNGTWDRDFGYSFDPTFEDYRFHGGRDMLMNIGDLVFAMAEGTVSVAKQESYWGGRVEIKHGGGLTSVYLGVMPSGIKAGQKVVAGDTIGTIMPSPTAEKQQPAHLHIEILLNGEKEDPALYIK